MMKCNHHLQLSQTIPYREDAFSPNLEILDGESVDIVQGADIQFKGYSDDISTINPLDSIHQQSKNQYYDSGDSDDYAESDNWINKGKLNVIQEVWRSLDGQGGGR